MNRKRKIVLRVLAILGLVIVVLVGPNAFFYYSYWIPKTDLPPITVETSDVWRSPDVSPALSLSLLEEVAVSQEKVGAPSVSAAIAFDGAVQWAGAVGFAAVESRDQATVATRYRLGSTSKPMTAALLGHMLDNGDIELNRPIKDYVTDLPPSYRMLTARQLASHTAGVRHYSSSPSWWPDNNTVITAVHYATVKDGLSVFIDDPLEFPAGSDFGYSTFGFSLLSYAMEGAADTDFKTLMETQLFAPLSMHDTAFDLPGDMAGRASFYVSGDGKYSSAYPSNASYKLAGGGIVASPSDVATFGLALLGHTYLDEATSEILFTPVKLNDGSNNPQNYGLGFRIDTALRLFGEDNPTQIIHHGGSQNGGGSFFLILPEYGISVSVLTNTGDGAARAELQELAYQLVRKIVAENSPAVASRNISSR